MDPIVLLMNEHRRIERFLEAVRGLAARLRAADPPPPKSDLSDAAEFIRGFADALHHGKEEEILFETMCRHGFSERSGPVAVMLVDHTEGRSYVAVMREVAAAPGDWTAEDRARAARALDDYAALLTGHILKEDQVLYPMARHHLPGDAFAEVARRCDEFEASQRAGGEVDRLVALGDRLITTYGAAGR